MNRKYTPAGSNFSTFLINLHLSMLSGYLILHKFSVSNNAMFLLLIHLKTSHKICGYVNVLHLYSTSHYCFYRQLPPPKLETYYNKICQDLYIVW